MSKRMLNEEFRPIKGFEGIYGISNKGDVFSYSSLKRLKPFKMPNGYLQVTLYSQGELKTKTKVYVHRLVAEAFIENPNNLSEVNHKDENKENNSVDNLEWITRKGNMQHGTRTTRQSLTLQQNKKQWKPVDCFKKNGEFVCTYINIKTAAEHTGIAETSISACCKNKPFRKTAGGFIWKYHSEVVV